MEGGDNLGSDFKLRQERLRQSERYKDIMENPNIVTFGQYRLKQEGNYAPEEMYGETERRRIRSSTDSDTRSPTRRHQSLLENGHCDVINGNMNNNGAVSSKSIGKSDQDEGSTDTDSSHDTYNADEERSLSVFEDLPSLNSTAMMADYSICSNASDQQSPNTLNTEHNDTNQPAMSFTDRPAPPNNTINKLLKGGLNGIFDSYTARPSAFGRPIQHSSPLRDRVAMDDINKFSSASGGSLQERLDEMLAEYKVVRVALEQLYKCLDKEEEQKAKLENENRSLWGKNVDMTKEVVRLNKLLDSKGESNLPLHHNIPKVTQSTQTDSEPMKNMWYKTELRSIEDDIKEAAKHLKQVKEIKANFSREIDEAELKLDRLLEGRFWTDTLDHPPDP
uniref:Uncharacterized protein n=1 Tax=Ciona savignyi TaxID=51511 RepID=H2YTU2_CIOSA